MNLYLKTITNHYTSNSQLTRVLTENWVENNMFCPRCGNNSLSKAKNNKPVFDFFCPSCQNEFELKSGKKTFLHKIPDGSYDKMLQRITANNNPDFFFLQYASNFQILNFTFIPKHFFIPELIEKRKPLSQNAKRAGWVGCNILVSEIPIQGQINIITNGIIHNKQEVLTKVQRSNLLANNNISEKTWKFEILKCLSSVNTHFTLQDIYFFEKNLYNKFPNNNNIKAKIRQQLQFLRNDGFIIFLGNGIYKKDLNFFI